MKTIDGLSYSGEVYVPSIADKQLPRRPVSVELREQVKRDIASSDKNTGDRSKDPTDVKGKNGRRSTAKEAQWMRDDGCHQQFARSDNTFYRCCVLAGVEPTKRQASKFRRGIGAAFEQLKNL